MLNSNLPKKMLILGVFAFSLAAGSAMAVAGEKENTARPTLYTNQKILEDVAKKPGFDTQNLEETLDFVFSSLPDKVKVYPTENYYYFSFFWKGYEFTGNMRLAARDRDKGILHFAYFPAANNSSADGEMHYRALSARDGVKVTKISELVYNVTLKNRVVTFYLNDLRDVKPPLDIIGKDEVYIGPIYDESGIQLYLLYNKKHKIFHYILNQKAPLLDLLQPIAETSRIEIGRRTGFAFYKDKYMDRKILIGVHRDNTIANNYFDGPFDQLPDNFLKNDTLKNAISDSDPSTKGKIDNFGYFNSGEGRYLISPYIQYEHPGDMLFYHQCAAREGLGRDQYYKCFSVEGGGE